jgi:protein-tyrosine phosphatase
MSAVFIDLNQAEDVRDVIQRAVEALSSGKIIAIPTETVYGLAASALQPAAVKRLWELKGRDSSKPFAVAVKSLEDSLDYVPEMSPLARRLARRCWPGPVTLVMDDHPESVIHQLDQSVIDATVPTGSVGLRVPDHDVTLQILRLCAGPIVLTSANLAADPAANDGQTVLNDLGDHVDMIIDAGPTRFQNASTVVKVDGDRLTVLREGAVKESVLRGLTDFIAVVVCTGNTCRSPMAEAMLKKQFSAKFGCGIDQLTDFGVNVMSAGISAMPGAPAANQSVEVMRQYGVDISDHSSQPMTGRLAKCADLILTLTNGHRDAIVSQWPELKNTVKTLRPDGGDISDPIGSPVAVYQSCAQQIDQCIEHWLQHIDFSQFSKRT